MSIPTYVPGYPQDGSTLGQSKTQIRNNLDGTFQTLGVDHVNNNGVPGANPAGYHTTAHFILQGSTPAPTTNAGQLFCNNLGALFYQDTQTPSNVTQLTRNFAPVVGNTNNAPGYSWMAGALLLQWGKVTGLSGHWTAGPQTVNFATTNRNFSSACFGVWLTFIGPSSTGAGELCVNSVSSTGFVWAFSGALTSTFDGFYWFALGF